MKNKLKKAIESAVSSLKEKYGADFDHLEIEVDYPKNEAFGDYTTNVAMMLGKVLKKNPMEVAEEIVKELDGKIDGFEAPEIVKPGYINFRLAEGRLQELVGEISELGKKYGESGIGNGIRINNEFISANPTGPLHLGNGRGGFFGDTLSRVFRKAGYEVVNEYYLNDAGEQVMKLGHSVLKDSEAAYAGEYIDNLHEKLGNISDVREAGEKAAKEIIDNIIKRIVKEKMGIHFDLWFSEKKLQADGYVDKAIEIFKEKDLTYEKDEALWLKTTEFGDDKDRVLIKKDGQKTYFASDCGYILNKMERGFDVTIETWGADHHGYIARFKAAAEALGFKGELRFVIVQMVRLVKDGKEVRMSKRAGNVVYIDELIDKIGIDVARFFFLMYSCDTHMNFDLGLAEERSQKNPVYYVQYAHARISSILGKAEDGKFGNGKADLGLLKHEKELDLIRELNKFPELIEEVAKSYDVHKFPYYAIKIADRFHSFYNDCRVIDEENPALTTARLELIRSAKTVLGEVLGMLGVSAPEKM
ncbi:MAG: arginine--tRNA ligase [Candidatus Moranbacteria bacterium]|nr:arginine--tRNA ligase [Candidatus Moranbacteria bacterium]